MAWPSGGIPTIGSGGFATSAQFNDFRDALKAIGDPWPSYSPTLTAATTDPTIGASSVSGYYRKLGNTCDIDVDILIGSGWAPGTGNYRISFPSGITPRTSNASDALGFATIRDANTTSTTEHTAYYFAASAFAIIGVGGVVGPGVPITWATGDLISVRIRAMQVT